MDSFLYERVEGLWACLTGFSASVTAPPPASMTLAQL
jgi:hypothetical protein